MAPQKSPELPQHELAPADLVPRLVDRAVASARTASDHAHAGSGEVVDDPRCEVALRQAFPVDQFEGDLLRRGRRFVAERCQRLSQVASCRPTIHSDYDCGIGTFDPPIRDPECGVERYGQRE